MYAEQRRALSHSSCLPWDWPCRLQVGWATAGWKPCADPLPWCVRVCVCMCARACVCAGFCVRVCMRWAASQPPHRKHVLQLRHALDHESIQALDVHAWVFVLLHVQLVLRVLGQQVPHLCTQCTKVGLGRDACVRATHVAFALQLTRGGCLLTQRW